MCTAASEQQLAVQCNTELCTIAARPLHHPMGQLLTWPQRHKVFCSNSRVGFTTVQAFHTCTHACAQRQVPGVSTCLQVSAVAYSFKEKGTKEQGEGPQLCVKLEAHIFGLVALPGVGGWRCCQDISGRLHSSALLTGSRTQMQSLQGRQRHM